MSRSGLRKAALVLLAGGVLLQVGGCLTVMGPIALSLLESTGLTILLGRAF